MKKLLLLLALVIGSFASVEAQNYKYYTTDFAFKIKADNGSWTDWSDWIETRCLVNINLDREEICIYSDTPQEFTIYDSDDDVFDDDEGGSQFEMACIDADGLRCSVRLRVQSDGQLQLYVDYNDIMYVYCLEGK
jgi:hypothetical protein